jgi:hypothetical protein
MNAEEREKMGSAGRAFYDKVFAKNKVIDSVNEILKP